MKSPLNDRFFPNKSQKIPLVKGGLWNLISPELGLGGFQYKF
ncbi:hypothetical protein D082_24710 [Synechocystis sp. PCC 6714]|nr:hypothetical protein D082_24710 [Synechocystis sp. PCC 6714]